jgi:uncharacterized lipoprotein YbaY
MEQPMKHLILLLAAGMLAACSAPKPPQPTGAWVPVNHLDTTPATSAPQNGTASRTGGKHA